MNPLRHVIRVTTKNMRAEVRVNDVPVAMLAPGDAETPAEVPINEFLVSDQNEVSVIMHANPLPSRVLEAWSFPAQPEIEPTRLSSIELVLECENDGTAALAGPLCKIAWSGAVQTQPLVERKRFEVIWKPPAWGWTRARELNPGSDLDLAYQNLLRLHQILVEKDHKTLAELLEPKLREVTTGAYGVPEGPMGAALGRGITNCMNDPSWTLLPCGPHDVDLRIVGKRRLVECLRPNGTHALVYMKRGSNASFFLPTMLGKLDGVWQVLR